MQARDPITCHVLDTTTGRPGTNISVSLFPTTNPSYIFTCPTNSDGRITNWATTSTTQNTDIASLITSEAAKEATTAVPKGSSTWMLRFETGQYYGLGKTFFPVVELTILVKEGEHFHVPLLLGPFSFTTYRGS